MNYSDFLTTVRPVNCAMAAIAVFIGASIALGQFAFSLPVLYAMIAAFLVCAGGITVNDYFDFEIDSRTRPKFRTIALHNKEQLLLFTVIFFGVGNAFAFLVNDLAVIIAGIISILLVLYSALLHRAKFIGNPVVALGTALPLVFGAAVYNRFDVVAWLSASAFFANWAREIAKDFQDEKKDRGHKTSLAHLISHGWGRVLIGVLLLLAIISVYVSAYYDWFSKPAFLVLVTLANLLFLKAFFEFSGLRFEKSQKTFKTAMLIALAGFLLGIL